MEILYLKEFLELAKVCNYGKASDNLYISQSSLFKHIKSLETELGVPLFGRDGKNIVLNKYGQIFTKYAEHIVQENSMLSSDITSVEKFDNQIIHIVTCYKIINPVAEFRSFNDNYFFNLESAAPDAADLKEQLDNGSVDMAFVHEFSDTVMYSPEDFNKALFLKDRMVLVVYDGHPLADCEEVAVTDLAGENFIMPPHHDNDIHDPGERIFTAAGFGPRVIMNTLSGGDILSLVSQKLGITVLAENLVGDTHYKGLHMVRLIPDYTFNISICTSKIARLHEGAQLFYGFARNYYAE